MTDRHKPTALYYEMLNYQSSNMELLEEHFDLVTLETPEEDTVEILERIEVGFAPLGFDYDRKKIDRMENLRVIVSNTTGEPHIDREYAESNGIAVFSLKDEDEFLDTITPTAEHTWGLLLAVMRNIPQAYQSVLEGTWSRWLFPGPAMLSNLTIGIVGMGRLGRIVADYARAFRMEEIAFYDPTTDADFVEFAEKVDSLEDLVSAHDVITIHAPANEETNRMFDREVFSRFKQGSYLVNTARAALIDEEALVEALSSGPLAGAAFDVFDGEYEVDHEQRLQESPLYRYAQENDDLLLTPHIGGSTYDAWEKTQRRVISKAIDYIGDD